MSTLHEPTALRTTLPKGAHPRQNEHARSQNQRAAWNSIFLTLLLISAKLAVALATSSLAILSQATENAFDLIALFVTLLAVRISSIPADDDHLYGHGKFENLSALAQALLLLTATGFIAFEAFGRLFQGDVHIVVVNFWSFAVLIGSLIIDGWRTRVLYRTGKDNNSQALEANAVHFMTDMIGGCVTLAALILVKFFGIQSADAWSALCVSAIVIYLSLRLGKRAVDGLTDRFVEKKEYQDLRAAIASTNGVESVRRLRVRQAGPYYFIEVTVGISRVLPYAAIESILKSVEAQIAMTFAESDITVHWYPVRTAHESPFETLKLITSEYGILPHNLELSKNQSGDIFLDFHLEFPPQTALLRAHELSRTIEQRVLQELPTVSRVTSHMEEERSDATAATVMDVTGREAALVSEIETAAKYASAAVRRIHDVRLTEQSPTISEGSTSPKALKLVMTLDLEPEISLALAHDIATIVETEVRRRFPSLGRIVVHVSPSEAEKDAVSLSEGA